jgi:hypothetical protein
MRAKYLAVPAIALCMVGVGFTDSADASAKAKTKVTIHAENTDLSGTVKSKKPYKCAANRTVLLVQQIGKRGGGNDKLIAYDTASLEGGVYRWSTGNTGIEGKFYAKVKSTHWCKGAKSKTVRATRSD